MIEIIIGVAIIVLVGAIVWGLGYLSAKVLDKAAEKLHLEGFQTQGQPARRWCKRRG